MSITRIMWGVILGLFAIWLSSNVAFIGSFVNG